MMEYRPYRSGDVIELNSGQRTLLTLVAGLLSPSVTAPCAHALAAEAAVAHVINRKEFDATLWRERTKSALVYFTAQWCALCRSIDARVCSHPVIKHRRQRIALVRVDVTVLDAGARAHGAPARLDNDVLLKHEGWPKNSTPIGWRC